MRRRTIRVHVVNRKRAPRTLERPVVVVCRLGALVDLLQVLQMHFV
jgi:hypothetical protein